MYHTLVTIKPNKFIFDRNKYFNNHELLKNDIMEYVEIVNYDVNDFMATIVEQINLTPELIGSSPICHESHTNIFQICYAGQKQNDFEEPITHENPNMIANYLTHDNINGNCVFINSKITNDLTCVTDDATIIDLVRILYSKYIHIGLFIGVNDSVKEFYYGNHPLEYYRLDNYDENKYNIKEIEFISLGLCCVIDLEDKRINKRMTRIMGNDHIYGDVLLILKTPEQYQDLGMDLYDKIDLLSYGPLSSRILSENEKKDVEKNNDLFVVNNKYCIIESRLIHNNYKYKCGYDGCNIDGGELNICKGCYKIKYHNKDCQSGDWVNHKNDCLCNK